MVKVEHLTKYYGDYKAVDDLSFELEDNHVYGFLGPNGAGKSTTMNIMTGCLSATEGKVLIGDYDIFEQPKEAKRKIGYLPEIPPLYTEETVTEFLYFVARAKSVPKGQIEEEINRVIELAHLDEYRDRLIKHLSKGYRQRVGIAMALVGNPEIIILDEPTVGLDPEQIIEIRNLIRSLKNNHIVILSSHILSEIQAVCEKVIIIAHGRLIAFDEPQKIMEHIEGNLDSFEDAFIELTHQVNGKPSANEPVYAVQTDLITDDGIEISINETAEEPEAETVKEAEENADDNKA